MSGKPTNKVTWESDDYEWADDETRMRFEEMRQIWEETESRRRWDIMVMANLIILFLTLTASLTLVWLLLSF